MDFVRLERFFIVGRSIRNVALRLGQWPSLPIENKNRCCAQLQIYSASLSWLCARCASARRTHTATIYLTNPMFWDAINCVCVFGYLYGEKKMMLYHG